MMFKKWRENPQAEINGSINSKIKENYKKIQLKKMQDNC